MLHKYRKGNMGDLVGTAFCLLLLMVVVITSIHFYKILEVKKNIDNISRGYLLRLEEQGELTNTEVSEIKTRIGAMGLSNTTVTYNDNNTKRNHGQEVKLEVFVTATRQELGLAKVYDYIKDSYDFKTTLYSTSKE